MMTTFAASRLSMGNQICRSKIIIDSTGITFSEARLFRKRQNTVAFDNIASVYFVSTVNGYSTIIVETEDATELSARGFAKKEVETIKKLIQGKF